MSGNWSIPHQNQIDGSFHQHSSVNYSNSSSSSQQQQPQDFNEQLLLAALKIQLSNGDGNNIGDGSLNNPQNLTQPHQQQFNQNSYPFQVDTNSRHRRLRPPDINQIPPDVLASLLKSSRVEELKQGLIDPTVNDRRMNRGNQQNTSPSKSEALPISPQQQQRLNQAAAKLSPLAKEFVPRYSKVAMSQSKQDEEVQGLAMAISQMNSDGGDSFQDDANSTGILNNSDCVLAEVTETISTVSQNPAEFNRCSKRTVDVLNDYLQDPDTLKIVVMLICGAGSSNPNFAYSGARLCHVMHKSGIQVGSFTFKNALLAHLQQEMQDCIKDYETDEQAQLHIHGVLMFFSELYMNFKVETADGKSEPIWLFGVAAGELLEKLVKVPTYNNIKCVFQILKLIGWELDNSTYEKVNEQNQKLWKELSLLNMSQDTEENIKRLLNYLFELKNKNWNKDAETSAGSVSGNSDHGNAEYYEVPDSDDEVEFELEDGEFTIDDEPEEVQAAYEEFLKAQQSQK